MLSASRVERTLRKVDGINSVTANPLTGNVLVLFDPESLTHRELIDLFVAHRYINSERTASQKAKRSAFERLVHPEELSKAVTDVVLQTAVEIVVKRAVLALI